MTIAVILEGGLVQSVVSDDPKDVGKKVQVVGYDTDGADPHDDKLSVIPQRKGELSIAFTHVEEIQQATINIKGIRDLTDEEKEEDW